MLYLRSQLVKIAFLVIFFASMHFLVLHTVEAASLQLDPTTITANPNGTFDIKVVVDAGTDQILAIDSYVVYDTADLKAEKVTNGTFFPTVFSNIFTGKVYIAGIVDDPATFKTGSGAVATITFRPLRNASGKLTFYCVDGASDSSKIIKNDVNSTNIITCSLNGSAPYTIGTGAAPTVPPGGTAPGTTIAPTVPAPTALPRTGSGNNVMKYGVPAVMLLLIGIGAKLIL